MAKKILIYYTGTIGDTIIAFPAFQMIRQQYPTAHITLLSALQGKYSATEALLGPTNYIDDFICYTLPHHCWMRILMAVMLICKLRLRHFDELVYLARDDDPIRRKRDKTFFMRAGIHVFHGIDAYTPGEENGVTKNVSQRIIDTLSADGVGTPRIVESYGDFQLTDQEKEKAKQWFESLPIPEGSIPVAYGMGGKKMSFKWPLEKHRTVLEYLVKGKHIFPLFFGDDTSRADEEEIIQHYQTGVRVASQKFSLRESIAVMGYCRFYIGHDTGTLHMAAAAGLNCIGIYGSQQPEGKWYPPGEGHIILRKHCDCEGCGRLACDTSPSRCIELITPEELLDAVRQMLTELHL